MAVRITLQPELQLIGDLKAKDVFRHAWQGKSTAYGLRQKAALPIWLIYSWATSQLSCSVSYWTEVSELAVKMPLPPLVDKTSTAFTMNPLSLDRFCTVLLESHDSCIRTLGMTAIAATAFTIFNSANPCFSCLTCFYFEVCAEDIGLTADFMCPHLSCKLSMMGDVLCHT